MKDQRSSCRLRRQQPTRVGELVPFATDLVRAVAPAVYDAVYDAVVPTVCVAILDHTRPGNALKVIARVCVRRLASMTAGTDVPAIMYSPLPAYPTGRATPEAVRAEKVLDEQVAADRARQQAAKQKRERADAANQGAKQQARSAKPGAATERARQRLKNARRAADNAAREEAAAGRGGDLDGLRMTFRSFNDLALLQRTRGITFSEADFQAMFRPMLRAWTRAAADTPLSTFTLVNNNWTQNVFHTKLMRAAAAFKMPEAARMHATTRDVGAVSGLLRAMSMETAADTGAELLFESMRIDYTDANGYEIRVYDKNNATPLNDYTFRCEVGDYSCATPRQLMQKCTSHEHFVVGDGKLLLTQYTMCDIGSENLKTYSIMSELQQAPPLQPDERVQVMAGLNWKIPGEKPTRAPGGKSDWWYDDRHTQEKHEVRWRLGKVWRTIDRSHALMNNVRWQLQKSNGDWVKLHTDRALLTKIETEYLAGRRMLSYASAYHKPNPDLHKFVVDFGEMHQVDIFFPADPGRRNKIRRLAT